MTTIAFDGITLAADTLSCEGTLRDFGDTKKIQELENGDYIALAGSSYLMQAYLNGEIKPRDYRNGRFLRVHPDGSAEVTDSTSYWFPVVPPFALGSGGELALGAMLAGASAKQAVIIASKVDTQTGKRVQVVPIKKT